MKVLITGAGGNLGSALVDALEGSHELVLSDVFDPGTSHESRQADLRNIDEVLPLARGCDFIVHTTAWHGMHGGIKSEVDFWQLNVDGSFNVFQLALQHGVRRMVWISSVSIGGWEKDKYGFSKLIGEQLCGFYNRVHGFGVAIVRPWDFTPYGGDFMRYGARLLAGGVDRRDVAGATVRAMDQVAAGAIGCEWFEIGAAVPFTAEDCRAYESDPRAVIEKHWPDSWPLIEKHGVRLPARANVVDLTRTRDVLGYDPVHSFGTFLDESRAVG